MIQLFYHLSHLEKFKIRCHSPFFLCYDRLSLHFFSLCLCLFITVFPDTNHKISANLPVAPTISSALKMAASAHCGCQTVCLMADSSATATVSSQREAASIFPIVPNEISITYMQVYQYFHRFLLAHRA